MIELPTDLPADLAPLSWLLGVWEGTGVIEYTAGERRYQGEFSHRVSFSHDGGPFLNYAASASFLGAEGADEPVALLAETGFPLQVSRAPSVGTLELYLGRISGPRIDIATDAVVRPAGSRAYSAASRMYGLVDGHLLWAWDIAALGTPLRAHASARLARV